MGNELKTIRPVLIALPLGLLIIAALFDVADFAGGWSFFGDVAFWNLAAAAVTGAFAAVAGLPALFALPMRSAARRVATTYGLVHIWSVGLLGMVWLARAGAEHRSVGAGLFIVEILGYAGIALAFWHGAPVAWRGVTGRGAAVPAEEEAAAEVIPGWGA